MEYRDLLRKVAEHVTLFYAEHHDERLKYHNESHISETVDITAKMSAWYKLDERDHFVVCAAAWFHDTGYVLDTANHESKSAELASIFLKTFNVEEDIINDIKKCILATRIPQTPVSLVEEIVCDADLFNFGTSSFKEYN